MRSPLLFRQSMTDLGKFFAPANLAVDEQRKRGFLALFLLTLNPLLFIFGMSNLFNNGLYIEVVFIFLALLIGLVNLIALRYVNNILPFFRLGLAVLLSMITVEVAIGNGKGMAFLWFYFHPIAAFFLFSTSEGLFWVLLSWFLALILFVFNLGHYHYATAISIRFMVTYSLVSILSYGLESSRRRYYTQLLAEKAALEAALQQVNTLQGLLPICASCKNIRDDAGYWHQVESYISHHMAVEFSHSICPDCRTKLYSQFVRKGQKKDEMVSV